MDSSDKTEKRNGPVEAEESDSGDSLFLTQIPQNTEPYAARSPHLTERSTPISSRFIESGSSSGSEDEGHPGKRKRRPTLLKYNFPFLNQKKSQLPEDRFLTTAKNRAIHHRGVVGFFYCVGDMWPSGQRRESFELTLPTVDADNEEITPITEDDESGEEDVKIIDKRQFVYSIQPKITKSSQPWFTSLRNKIAETTKPTRKSVSRQHFGMEKSSSNMPEDLSKEICVVLDNSSDSDETFIDESIKPRSPANDAHSDTVNLTQVNQVTDHGDVLSPLDESEDNESQSILQNSLLDIRGRQFDSIYDVKELLSTKTKQRDKRLEYGNKTLNTSLSQQSVDLFEDYITSYHSPHRHKDNTPRKTVSNDLITEKKNGDTEEKLNDVESDLEATSLTELMPESCNQENQVKGQNLPKDAELPLHTNDDKNNGDGTVQKIKDYMENAEKEQNRTNFDSLQIVNNLEEVKGQSLPEDTELISCSNVDVQDSGDGAVRKKKKHKKKKGNVENEEIEQNWTNLHPQQIVNNLEKEVPGQSLPEDTELLSCPNVDVQDDGDGAVRKKKKHKKKNGNVENSDKEQNGTYLDPLQIDNNGQSDNNTAVNKMVSDMSDNKRKEHKKKRKAARDCDDEVVQKEFQLNINKSASCGLAEGQEISELVNNDNTDAECLIQDDEPVSVRKKRKKKSHVSSTEKEQNGIYLEPMQIVNNAHLDDIIAVDKIVPDTSDNERKHKKKRKAVSDEDLALKRSPFHNTNKNSSSEIVGNCENSELVNNNNTDTDCLVIQGDKSVSKKKNKRKAHAMAETVENVTLDVTLSGEGHGADRLDISTNYTESAENDTCLQETELGNKVKKKTRNGELNHLDPNAKVMENPEMNECNQGSDCDSIYRGDRMKKKKKTSQSEHCQTGMGKTTAGRVKKSAVLSPKKSDCPERKMTEKKRQLCGESVVVETSEETELEQNTVKRKKLKGCFKDHEQTVFTPLHVEISPSSGKREKNGQKKVKKRLYNPNDTFFDH